jgi:hypothetical protein
MNSTFLRLCLAAIALAGLPASSFAHHSVANFDSEKEIVLKGVVTAWLWSNPHCILRFDAKDDTGTVRNWAVEVQNPTNMTSRGWSRKSFSAGDAVTVALKPGKGGVPIGLITTVTLPNGQKLYAGGPPPAGAPATAAPR